MADDSAFVLQTSQERQDERINALPALYTQQHERLAMELALGMEEPTVIFARFGYNADQSLLLLGTPSFVALLNRVAEEVKENGTSFRMKARVQAEALLAHSFMIATDPDAPTSERVKLIQWTAKMGALEPKEEKGDGPATGGFNLTIQFAGQAPQQVISSARAPLTIENE